MADTPAGWYPNPENPSTERWWDGYQWSDATRPTTAVPQMGQPSAWGGQPSTLHKPDNYLVWSILVTLFCCLPFGIAAIVNAAKVDGLWSSGDYYGAQRAAAQAKKWCAWSVGLGLVIIVLYGLMFVVGSTAEPTYTQY